MRQIRCGRCTKGPSRGLLRRVAVVRVAFSEGKRRFREGLYKLVTKTRVSCFTGGQPAGLS